MVDFNDWIGVVEVVASERIPDPPSGPLTDRTSLYTLRVTKQLKGFPMGGGEIQIATGRAWGCGYDMRVGDAYLVGAVQRATGYYTNVCNGNAWLDAPEDQEPYAFEEAWARAVEVEIAGRDSGGGCGFGSPFGMLQSVALLGLGAAVVRRKAFSNPTTASIP